MKSSTELLLEVDSLKQRLDSYRPLPTQTARSLHDKLALEWTYNSNGIEGNTLTLRETQVVIEGITVGGKTLREHLEAVNHRDAIELVETLVGKGERITERDILDIHSLVVKGINDQEAGKYRQQNVVISGASTIPPDFLHDREAMQALLAEYVMPYEHHQVEHIARLHTRFVEIHPFADGNGRSGRLLMNLELMKHGYPPAVLRVGDRLRYYETLTKACLTGDFEDITSLVAEAISRSLTLYLDVVAPGATLKDPAESMGVSPNGRGS